MAKGSVKAYLGVSWIVAIILAIIPFTNIILGIVYRLQKGDILLAVLNLILFPIFGLIDLVSIVLNKDLKWLV